MLFVAIMFVIEMVVCAFVLLPLPRTWRKKVLVWLSDTWENVRARAVLKTMWSIVFLFLAEHTYHLIVMLSRFTTPLAMDNSIEFNLRVYQAQRNIFVSAGVLFLGMLLYRFEGILYEYVKLEKGVASSVERFNTREAEIQKMMLEREEYIRTHPHTTIPYDTSISNFLVLPTISEDGVVGAREGEGYMQEKQSM